MADGGKVNTGGPYLNAALLCERVLQERDGVTSLIRVIDRVTVTAVAQGNVAGDLPPTVLAFTVYVALKSGVYKGSLPVKLSIKSPDDEKLVEFSTDVLFEGDDRGVNIVSPVQFQIQKDGLFWIDLSLMDELITRIPLRVVVQRVSQGSLPWPPKSE